jgi:dolichol-phosphate mannosyltransferase
LNTHGVKRRVYVLLPAYNEADNIVILLNSFSEITKDSPYEFFFTIVDDGSTDTTDAVIEPYFEILSLTILRHSENKGLSEALRNGFLSVLDEAEDEDVIICMDADNTHMPAQVHDMLHEIENGNDVVIASRFRKGASVRGVSLFRRFLSLVSSFLCRACIPIQGVRDYSCGFRTYRAGILRSVLSDESEHIFSLKGFACTSAILFSLNHAGAKITEIPIDLRYFQKRGVSKMNVTKTSVESIRVIFREIWRRVR